MQTLTFDLEKNNIYNLLMHRLNLKQGDPLVLTLAADSRVCQTDYLNDLIWNLSIGGGEPSALSVNSTFGLRARIMRIFPIFKINDLIIIDPDEYSKGVTVNINYPNFISLAYSPISELDVQNEYWVPDSQQIAGRMRITNNSQKELNFQVEWAAILTPSTEGERMSPIEFGAVTILAGSSGDLKPIFFVTGGPNGSSGPYPCLSKLLNLNSGSSYQMMWVFSALKEHGDSLDLARTTASLNWNGITANLDMVNSGNLDIRTGDDDWDMAIKQAQKIAFSLIMENKNNLPNPSYVSSRSPDQGYSKRGDGSDYDHTWSGQTPLETYFFIDYLLPAHLDLAKGLLDNFLFTQTSDGFIDWKSGLNGYRSQLLSTPILASLALRIYRSSRDLGYLKSVYPKLLTFIDTWFQDNHDQDQDGIPEWDHVLQTGFEDNPLFTYWNSWSYGISISKIESPDICALLFRECSSLIEISQILADYSALEFLENKVNVLGEALANSWNNTFRSYRYWDRDTHTSAKSQAIGERSGSGDIIVNSNFEEPLRLNILLEISDEIPYDLQLFIHGITSSGTHRIERISSEQIQWHLSKGYCTSERAYKSIDHIFIQGASDRDMIKITSVNFDFQNQSLLLPLWAGIPNKKRAKLLIKKTITDNNRYWRPYGVRSVADLPLKDGETNISEGINILWNSLIVEGLIKYGYRSLAADLISRNMLAIIQSLKSENSFRRLYNSENGVGIGEKNVISSLVPIGAFLSTLGVQIISQNTIRFDGFNPFPWPVTLKYRGLTIIRQKKNTMIIFPDGKNMTVRNGKSQTISLE